jgi:hypothetical protein
MMVALQQLSWRASNLQRLARQDNCVIFARIRLGFTGVYAVRDHLPGTGKMILSLQIFLR